MGGLGWAGAGPRELSAPLRSREKSWEIMLELFGKVRNCSRTSPNNPGPGEEVPGGPRGPAGAPQVQITNLAVHRVLFGGTIDDEVVGLLPGGNGRALPHLSRAGVHVALSDEEGDGSEVEEARNTVPSLDKPTESHCENHFAKLLHFALHVIHTG